MSEGEQSDDPMGVASEAMGEERIDEWKIVYCVGSCAALTVASIHVECSTVWNEVTAKAQHCLHTTNTILFLASLLVPSISATLSQPPSQFPPSSF